MSGPDLIDTHAHLDFEQFEGDVDGALKRAGAAGVGRLINVGTSLAHSRRSVALAEAHGNVFAAVGVHPHDAADVNDEVVEELKRLAAHKRVVAVGEVGFDFHYDQGPDETAQEDAFFAQSEVAVEAGLPIIVHSRDAEELTLRHLEAHAAAAAADNPYRQEFGVVHCFTGSLGFAEAALKLGYLISFTAPITYPKNEALRAVVKALPLDKLMVETDCPFLPPADRRGQRNEPAFVVATAQALADLKGIPLAEAAQATTANAERLFGLSPVRD
jgi:TatD DNase family protein